MRVGQVAAGIVLLSSLLYAVESFQLAKERAVLAQVESERDTIRSQIEGFRSAKATEKNRADPQTEIDALEILRDARLRTLRDLAQGGSQTDASFSSLLEGLARQDLDGIWLERIELSGGGDAVTIRGELFAPRTCRTSCEASAPKRALRIAASRPSRSSAQTMPLPVWPSGIATLDSTSASNGGDR